ncbi:MAG: hypothetical protein QOK35_2044, partial [Pseudonocardiales bacterium]|nr:hypothetical protein [Pseudonocardiales bacterium]
MPEPSAPPSPATEPATEATSERTPEPTVLIVDDHDLVGTSLAYSL